jgi:hypothetical protein
MFTVALRLSFNNILFIKSQRPLVAHDDKRITVHYPTCALDDDVSCRLSSLTCGRPETQLLPFRYSHGQSGLNLSVWHVKPWTSS